MRVVHFHGDEREARGRNSHARGGQAAENSVRFGLVERLQTETAFRWIIRLCFVATFLLGSWYLMLLNSIATRGFELSQIRSERAVIRKDLQKWDIEMTIPTSLYALQSDENVQGMAVVKNPNFMALQGSQVAYLDEFKN